MQKTVQMHMKELEPKKESPKEYKIQKQFRQTNICVH